MGRGSTGIRITYMYKIPMLNIITKISAITNMAFEKYNFIREICIMKIYREHTVLNVKKWEQCHGTTVQGHKL